MAGQAVLKTVSQDVISETVQPLYIGGKLADGSDAKVTIASNGNVSTATPLTVPSLTVNSKPVMSSLLAEYTVTGSAVTSIDFSGLDINTHKSYRVECDIICSTAGSDRLYAYVNGDTVSTNYYTQNISGNGTAVSAARENSPFFAYLMIGTHCNASGLISKTSNGYVRMISQYGENTGNALIAKYSVISKTATIANITQLTFTSAVANNIAVGSTIRIYRGDV